LPDEKNVIHHVNQPIPSENGDGQKERKKEEVKDEEEKRKEDLAVRMRDIPQLFFFSLLSAKGRFP
jgi:hypothetical protein